MKYSKTILVLLLFLSSYAFLSSQDFGEIKRIGASNANGGNHFGLSVSLDEDIAIAGTVEESAYIFSKNNGGENNWGEVKKLTASDANGLMKFGETVSISENTAIVGASFASGATGSAYIFSKNQGGENNWGEVKKLTASDADVSDIFGVSVSISKNKCIVGASSNKDQGNRTGAAYIYSKDQGDIDNWGEVKKLTASDAARNREFGHSVSITDNIAVVGAPGSPGDQGAVYVFYRNEGGVDNWGEVKKLTASSNIIDEQFGWSISLNNNVLIIGAPRTESSYIFSKDHGGADSWGEVKKLSPSTSGIENFPSFFGTSVSIDKNIALVGTGASHGYGGSTYIFSKNKGGLNNWGEIQKLTSGDDFIYDDFGASVAISDNTIITGNPRFDILARFGGIAHIFENDSLTAIPELELSNGDIYLEQISTGIILTNPNGDCFKVVVDENGSLSVNPVNCPE